MLYLKHKDEISENWLKQYGFKKCKRPYHNLWYLCIARGCKVIYIGDGLFISDWLDDDPRIHNKPNCRYKSSKEVLDVIYDLVKAEIVERR